MASEKSKKGRSDKRRGVIICGAYGLRNAGDDAILEAIIQEMREISPDMPITIITRLPEETGKKFGVSGIYTFDYFGFLRRMRRTKLYINGGGNLIQDVTSRKSLWYYLFTIAAAKLLGNKVIMYGCGIGPVQYPYNMRLVRFVLNKCVDIITLREDYSREELAHFGVSKPEIVMSCDPALSLRAAGDDAVDREMTARGLDPGGKYACFALRRWTGFNEKAGFFSEAANRAYNEYGLTPVFISISQQNDSDASKKCIEGLTVPYILIENPMETGITIGMMARMDVVISIRLHGLVFAAGHGVPLVGVSYDPKVSAFLDYIGEKNHIRLEDVASGSLTGLLDAAMEERGGKEERARHVMNLAEIERRNMEAAKRLLEDDGVIHSS